MTRSYGELPPSIDKRLETLTELRRQWQQEPKVGVRPTITISRRFGCEGFPLAEQLERLLQARFGEPWLVYDRALLERVAQQESLDRHLLDKVGGLSQRKDRIGLLISGYQAHTQLFAHIRKHVRLIAEAGYAIIVGRGGAIITRSLQNCYHFRLEADLDFRVASIARRLEMSEAEARQYVLENDRERDAFITKCLGTSPSDPTLYDAVFNNARHDVATIAGAIVSFVAETWQRRGNRSAGSRIQ